MDTDFTDFIHNAIRNDSLCDANVFRTMAYVKRNIVELIVMTRHFSRLETHIVLRMILNAGVPAVLLLACAGTEAGGRWVVDDDGGADFASIQAAVDAAGEGDTIEVQGGTYVENVDADAASEGGATRCCERGECPRMWG